MHYNFLLGLFSAEENSFCYIESELKTLLWSIFSFTRPSNAFVTILHTVKCWWFNSTTSSAVFEVVGNSCFPLVLFPSCRHRTFVLNLHRGELGAEWTLKPVCFHWSWMSFQTFNFYFSNPCLCEVIMQNRAQGIIYLVKVIRTNLEISLTNINRYQLKYIFILTNICWDVFFLAS